MAKVNGMSEENNKIQNRPFVFTRERNRKSNCCRPATTNNNNSNDNISQPLMPNERVKRPVENGAALVVFFWIRWSNNKYS